MNFFYGFMFCMWTLGHWSLFSCLVWGVGLIFSSPRGHLSVPVLFISRSTFAPVFELLEEFIICLSSLTSSLTGSAADLPCPPQQGLWYPRRRGQQTRATRSGASLLAVAGPLATGGGPVRAPPLSSLWCGLPSAASSVSALFPLISAVSLCLWTCRSAPCVSSCSWWGLRGSLETEWVSHCWTDTWEPLGLCFFPAFSLLLLMYALSFSFSQPGCQPACGTGISFLWPQAGILVMPHFSGSHSCYLWAVHA